MKKFVYLLFIALTIVSCNKTPKIEGEVTYIDSYGSVHTSFTIEEMLKKGFNYADIIKVEFDSSGVYYMPITTAYTEVGIGKPSYCHYSKSGEASFGYCQGDFHKMCGGNPNEHVKITQYKKLGYEKEYKLIQSVYYTEREKYPSDSVFANFREVQTSNIKPHTLYRSGNPLNFKSNPTRYIYVDSLAALAHINTEIDIADTYKQANEYIYDSSYTPTYCKYLLNTDRTICLGMGSDTFCESAYEKFADGMRFIIDNNPPYLIHCNEGKDRCGFYCMLLESLCGASVSELEYDYMTTFCNLYFFKRGTEQYNFNLKLTGDRLIYLMAHPDEMQNPNVDWDNAINEITKINTQSAAYDFLTIKCKMSDDEVSELKNKISK